MFLFLKTYLHNQECFYIWFCFNSICYPLFSSTHQKNHSFTNTLCNCGYFRHNRGGKQNNPFSLPNVCCFHKFQLKQSVFKGFRERQ